MNALLLAAILCNTTLWPGFDPCAIPVATFDGTRTTLERHPSPPPEFVDGVYAGRHPAITANSSADIGGVLTATVMPNGDEAVVAHEMFHVYQRTHHKDWSANEGDLLAYPVASDYDLVRLELDALRHALVDNSRDWARAALAIRAARFAKLDAASIAYERNNELNEGLATYVGHRAVATPDDRIIPARPFAPEEVRDRLYATGAAYARLLDRHAPQWRESLERETQPLDVMLANALRDVDAQRAVETYRARLDEQRRAFIDAPGWSIRIVPDAPLFPAGFDPLNVRLVANGEVLHTRFVKLANASGSIEVMNQHALTTAAGTHPLFQGMTELAITGLPREPKITREGRTVSIECEGVNGKVAGDVIVTPPSASPRRTRPRS
ncbi:MAG TPA: hypothetical protein VF787_19130 [Thermoanaerobaculia bacterium]